MSRKSKILSNAELSAFCQQISLIIAAGLPTYYGVSILCDEALISRHVICLSRYINQWSLVQRFTVHLKIQDTFQNI